MAYGSKASIFKVEEQHTNCTCSLKNGITFHLFTSHTPCKLHVLEHTELLYMLQLVVISFYVLYTILQNISNLEAF